VQALHGYARGDESVEREVFLARSVDDTLGLLQHRLRHVQIIKEVDPDVRVRGFPGQIDQVLMNLLTNAAQAMGDRAEPFASAHNPATAACLLMVSDDGPGIPADVLPRIFDPFFTTKDVVRAPARVVDRPRHHRAPRRSNRCGQQARAGDDLHGFFPASGWLAFPPPVVLSLAGNLWIRANSL